MIHTCCASESSPERIYRKTLQKWQSTQRDWNVWSDYNTEIISLFNNYSSSSSNTNTNTHKSASSSRLEYVGAMEEGILVIEKSTVAMGEGADIKRDRVLSQMYAGYGMMLFELNAQECHGLALDPHTLLIGAETVSSGDEPKRFLCIENAENGVRNAITLDATNSNAEDLLKQITGDSTTIHERKPKEFVAELFDSFADTFDSKLNSLEYKVPKILGNGVSDLKKQFRAVLDAGCGTGLAGRFVRPYVTELMVGVDASQKMLDIAGKCTLKSGCGIDQSDDKSESHPLYESLLQLDLEEMTVKNTLHHVSDKVSGFDLVIAADVLVYFGSLDNVLMAFANVSVEGANLIFSCERASGDEAPLGYRLLSSGRFSHTKQHVIESASKAGYHIVSYQEIIPRMERGEEVKGHLFTFELKRTMEL